MNEENTAALQDKLLAARVQDTVKSSEKSRKPCFLGFLDRHERQVAENTLKALHVPSYSFEGGYEGAERVYLGVFTDNNGDGYKKLSSPFPVSGIKIEWKFQKLSHRDFLGSLLSLGIERKRLGDIVVNDEDCVVFADAAVAGFIAENLKKVGGAGVKCRQYSGPVQKAEHFDSIRSTVSSERLDCVVAALAGVAREESSRLITDGLVSLNFEQVTRTIQKVEEESTVSIRGYGRFVVDKIGPLTRKGRYAFSARKYI